MRCILKESLEAVGVFPLSALIIGSFARASQRKNCRKRSIRNDFPPLWRLLSKAHLGQALGCWISKSCI